ncbi:SMI1/KNR4 family protein [Enterobacteriaceae bacterium RIT711]|nr:SMI1/KNR4 family protein [Enterobacteriaceae bacterium RIT711]
MLNAKNGFYAFESALHVFPFETVGEDIGLLEWNSRDLWINAYQDLALDGVYFAEDIFGGQFCIKGDGVYLFDPETADCVKMAENINGWCEKILNDYDFLTGYSLAHLWQKNNGPIPVGFRLIPKIPFVLGGKFEIENLYMEKSYVALKKRANIALQIKNLPDGQSVNIKLY